MCSQGQCGVTCLGGSKLCTTGTVSACVDTQNDPNNCGTCGMVCPGPNNDSGPPEVCSQGQCGVTCLGGSTLCGSNCVDTQNDPAHCGNCTTACSAGQVCSLGQCGVTCLGGSTLCGTSCVETANDPANCGGCASACPAGHVCACPAGQVCSTGTCGVTCLGGSTLCTTAGVSSCRRDGDRSEELRRVRERVPGRSRVRLPCRAGVLERHLRRDLPRRLHALHQRRRQLLRRDGDRSGQLRRVRERVPRRARVRLPGRAGVHERHLRRDLPRRHHALCPRRWRPFLRRDGERSGQLRIVRERLPGRPGVRERQRARRLGTTTLDTIATPAAGTAATKTISVGSSTGFAAGQQVFIHQTQGVGAGLYELNTVVSIAGTTITLTNALANTYTSTGANNHAQVIVVPQFVNLNVPAGSVLTAPAWNGTTGGILVFTATGTTTVAGTITMTGQGFRGASNASLTACIHCTSGTSGESTTGLGILGLANNGPGGGGGAQGQDCGMGSGGAYGTAGGVGPNGTTTGSICATQVGALSPAAPVFGVASLVGSVAFGGAGGEGGFDEDGSYAGAGGNGGGLIFITSPTLTVTGSITANGTAGGAGVSGALVGGVTVTVAPDSCGSGSGMGGGGGGAGGAIRIISSTTATLGASLITATGGGGGLCSAGVTLGGAGSVGRIGIKAGASTGTTNPAFNAN